MSNLMKQFRNTKYYADKSGKIYRKTKRGSFKEVKGSETINGYLKVSKYYIHRIIAELFVKGHSADKNDANHINHNKADNSAKNLEWVSHKENLVKHKKEWNNKCGPKGIAVKIDNIKFRTIREAAKYLDCNEIMLAAYFRNGYKTYKNHTLRKVGE